MFEPNYINLRYFFARFYYFIVGLGNISFQFLPAWLLPLLQVLWTVFSLGFVIIIIIVYFKLRYLRLAELKELASVVKVTAGEDKKENERWQKILQQVNSDNPSDWKMAIIEADKILDEMTRRMGYLGETIGERLKTVEASDFLTLDDAWEAHKARNNIAHKKDQELTNREAKRIIELYERVFREFHYI